MNIFRRLKLGGMYHALYQKWWSGDQRIKELEGSVRKLSDLAERRLTACKSLETQKAVLYAKVERLEQSNKAFQKLAEKDHALIDKLMKQRKEEIEHRRRLKRELDRIKRQRGNR